MDRLGRRQAAWNATSRGQWEGFTEHRRRLTGLLSRAASEGSRLCVLGAGNANDLDLPDLLAAHREVHLVDVDAEALVLGAERQGVSESPGLRLHGGVDVTATLGIASRWSPTSRLAPADLEALAAWPASRVAASLPGPFDRVASTCLLSQLLETAAHALGRGHAQLAEAETALRVGHLRLMARLTAPGGEASLVVEVVSSDEFPALSGLPEEELVERLARLGREGAHFRGMHPRQLLTAMRADPSCGPLANATAITPWRWRLHERTYLVSGLSFRPGRG